MDANQFDELLARLAKSPSRRDALKGLVGGALATVGVGAANAAESKEKGKGKANGGKGGGKGKGKAKGDGGKDGGVDAERCLPTGQRCGKQSGKDGGPCKKCCTRYDTVAPNGRRRCTCRPTSMSCTNSAQCCTGDCIGGACGMLS